MTLAFFQLSFYFVLLKVYYFDLSCSSVVQTRRNSLNSKSTKKAPNFSLKAFYFITLREYALTLQLPLHLHIFIRLHNIPYFNIIKIIDVQAAFVARINFFNIVFKAF